MSSIPCFMVVPTDRVELSLRRYAEAACAGSYSYHNASVLIGQAPVKWTESASGRSYSASGEAPPHDDPRWPKACECGYAFGDGDEWQLFQDLLYRRDTGDEYTLLNLPAGAMWNADWYPSTERGPDGLALFVKTPGGEWHIDGPSNNGPGWTRTGVAPKITAHPSIICGGYHGWLRDGELVPC